MDSSIIASIIFGSAGILVSLIVSIFFGYTPNQRKNKIIKLQKELLMSYLDINEFQKLEHILLEKSNISKQTARKDLNISTNSEPKKVQNRIKELQIILI